MLYGSGANTLARVPIRNKYKDDQFANLNPQFGGKMMIRQKSAALVLLLMLGSGLLSAQTPPVENRPSAPLRSVLILYGASPASPTIGLIDEAIRESFHQSKYRILIYPEYMNTLLFSEEADQRLFRDYYVSKYRHHRPDVVITVGSPPLVFMAEEHREHFAGIPVIFCVPNGAENDLKPDPELTGVTTGIEAAATLEAALHLLPKTKHVLVVGGTSTYDRQQVQEVKKQLEDYSSRVDISYATDLTLPELLKRLNSLPNNYIVLFSSMSRDGAGTVHSVRELGPLITSAADAPVFSLVDAYIGHGEVGGNLSEVRAQGTIAANVALKILDGVSPSDIPIARAPNRFVFDWRALKRWGIKESRLPPGSMVLNRPPTAWEMYRWYIIGAISLVLLEALLITALLWQRVRRRRTELDLAITHDRLRLAVEAGNSVGWDWHLRSGRERWFGDLRMLGIPSDTDSGHFDNFRQRVHTEDQEQVWNAISEARASHTPYSAEFRVIREDGSVRWITARGRFHYAADGDAERMLGMAVDITERKQAEEALRHSEGRLAALIGTALDAIVAVDEEQRIVLFNASAERIFGCPAAAAMGSSLERFIPERFRTAHSVAHSPIRRNRHIESRHGRFGYVIRVAFHRRGIPD